MPRLRSPARRALRAAIVAAAAAAALAPAVEGATDPEAVAVSSKPKLFPAFDPAAPDYVTHCDPAKPVELTFDAHGSTRVSVNGKPGRSGQFTVPVRLVAGRALVFSIDSGPDAGTYHVRCLPKDFPRYVAKRYGQPQAGWYVLGIGYNGYDRPDYAAVFDDHGAPVWWRRDPKGSPFNARLMPDGTIAWYTYTGGQFGIDRTVGFGVHAPDGKLVRTYNVRGGPTDFHELQVLPNNHAMMIRYKPRSHVDLSKYGKTKDERVVDGETQEVDRHGKVVWSWSTKGHIPLSDSKRWFPALTPIPLGDGKRSVYDVAHLNTIDPHGNRIVISLRYADAVYEIEKSSGRVVWKLGGMKTSKSLKVVGDPLASTSFGGQHDARLSDDGRLLTIFDNRSHRSGRPRAVLFEIERAKRTATRLQSITDPAVKGSLCCGGGAPAPGRRLGHLVGRHAICDGDRRDRQPGALARLLRQGLVPRLAGPSRRSRSRTAARRHGRDGTLSGGLPRSGSLHAAMAGGGQRLGGRGTCALLACAAATAAIPSAAGAAPLLPTGRPAAPAGRVTALQSFPTGAAAAPDGKTVLAVAGPVIQGGAPAGPSGGVALMVVDAATGTVRQTVNVDDAFQGVAYDRAGSHVYVAGGAGNSVHVFSVAADGTLSGQHDIPVSAFVSDVELSHDGRTLWAAEPTAGAVERIDLTGRGRARKIPASAPDRLALSSDGRLLFATDWRGTCVTQIETTGSGARCIRAGEHPTGVATVGDAVLAADSNDATLAVLDPGESRARRIGLAQVGRRTDAPNDVVLTRDGRTAYVSLGGDDAVAVMRFTGSAARRVAAPRRTAAARRPPTHRDEPVVTPYEQDWKLAGLIPTGWYPTALALSPDDRTLHVITARGLGHSAAATKPFLEPDPAAVVPDGAYGTVGTLETIRLPDRAGLDRYTAEVRGYLRARTVSGAAGNPIVAGRAGPIKHVIYVTRENKTYDADLGDLHPGPGASLAVFGQPVTPNLHALERQFVEAQSFYYQGFASTVGHMWEDAGAVSDLYEHTQAADTGAHTTHISDSWSDPANYPLTGTLTEQVWRAGMSVRTYNQETIERAKLLPDALQADQSVFPDYDLHIPDARREAGWESEFRQFEAHSCTGELARAYGKRCSLPDFEYVYFGEDHTTVVDEPGYPTIEAQVADNDYATGKLIDAVSHSRDWSSTLVIVIEDDPQGTGDHLSAYRGFVAVASPWVKRGLVTATHYDLTSAVGAIDRLLDLPPLTDYAATSRPLDEFFTDKPSMGPFQVDGSGIALNPFVPLPGLRAKSDPKHGIYSFTEPDATDPRIAAAATWRQLKGKAAPRLSTP